MVSKYFDIDIYLNNYELPEDATTGDLVNDFEDHILHGLPVPVDLETCLIAAGIDTDRLRRTIESNHSHD